MIISREAVEATRAQLFEFHFVQGVRRSELVKIAEEDETVCLIKQQGENVGDPDDTNQDMTSSSCSDRDKFTEMAENCVVLAITGQREQGQVLSMVAHVSPDAELRKLPLEQWFSSEAVNDFVRSTNPLSRRSIIVGGFYNYQHQTVSMWYRYLIGGISRASRDIFEADPLILPPKPDVGVTNLYLLNNDRRLIVFQNTPIPSYNSGPYYQREFDAVSKKWEAQLKKALVS